MKQAAAPKVATQKDSMQWQLTVTLLAGTLQEDCHCSDKRHALRLLVQLMFVAASRSNLHNLYSRQSST